MFLLFCVTFFCGKILTWIQVKTLRLRVLLAILCNMKPQSVFSKWMGMNVVLPDEFNFNLACNFMLRLRRIGDVVEFSMPTLSSIVLPLKFIKLRECYSSSNMNLIKYLRHMLFCTTVPSHFDETFVIIMSHFDTKWCH